MEPSNGGPVAKETGHEDAGGILPDRAGRKERPWMRLMGGLMMTQKVTKCSGSDGCLVPTTKSRDDGVFGNGVESGAGML